MNAMNAGYRLVLAFSCLLSLLILPSLTLAAPFGLASGITQVEEVVDRVIHAQMENDGIPGATVAIVSNGEVVLSKGYGTANLSEGIAVDSERTLFRIGSISKLFVWTAVMQLVEQGKLDLDADVNDYLDFEIPNRLYRRSNVSDVAPITLKHLMSHSAGFEDVPADLFHLHADQTLPLDEYVRTHVPARVFPPGELAAYSNYGSALAGYIVQRVSGISFAQYVEENIFTPLHMNRSTFRQPVDPTLNDDVAKGYRLTEGEFLEGDFAYALGPAGGMSSTAENMARFMLAHLDGGMVDGQRILSEEAVRQMHSPLFSQHPALDGMAYGFLEQSFNEQRVLYHMGSVLLFNSGMYLLPDTGVGVFVSYNGGGHMAPIELFRAFMNAFYPSASAQSAPTDTGASVPVIAPERDDRGGRAYTGEYYISRRSFTTDASLLSLLETLRVKEGDDGYLYVTHLGQTETFLEIEPGVYRNIAPEHSRDPYGAFRTLVFRDGPGGETVLLSDGPMSYTKAPWYASTGFTLAGMLISLLMLVGTGLFWFVRSSVNRLRGRSSRSITVATVARAVAAAFALITTGFFIGVMGISGDMEPAYGVPKSYFGIEPSWASMLTVFPIPMVVLGAVMAILSIVLWRQKLWGIGGRIHYTLVTGSAWVVLGILRGWHVI